MKMKIVADSSANLLALPDIDFGVVPLHIIVGAVSYTHLRAHETGAYLVCRLLLEKIFF